MSSPRPRLASRTAVLVTAAALGLGALAATSASAAPITTRTWVASPNGLVGVQQTVIVRAPKSSGGVATVTFSNATAGTNAGQAQVNSQGFAYLPWTPNVPGAWTISASVGGSSLGTSSIVVAAMPTETTLLTPERCRRSRQRLLWPRSVHWVAASHPAERSQSVINRTPSWLQERLPLPRLSDLRPPTSNGHPPPVPSR